MADPVVSFVSSRDLYEPSFIIDSECCEANSSFPEFKIQYIRGVNLPKNMETPFFLKDRIEQINVINCSKLSFDEVWNVSGSLQGVLKCVQQWKNSVFFKKKKKVPNIFSFVVDLYQKCFFVFLKKKSSFSFEGTFKKVREAMALPFDMKKGGGVVTAHIVNKVVKNGSGEIDIEESNRRYESFYEEKKIESKYKCCMEVFFSMTYFRDVVTSQDSFDTDGFEPNSDNMSPIIDIGTPLSKLRIGGSSPNDKADSLNCLDKKTVVHRKIRRFCVIEEKYLSLNFFCSVSHIESDWFCLAKNLMEGLIEVYADERFHGDVKMDNALWKSGFPAKWVDFGFSGNFGEENFFQRRGLQGYYGSIACTAPEVIGTVVYERKNILAAEAWAFGFMLFSLLEEAPPWSKKLRRLLKGKEKDPQSSKNEVFSLMGKYLGAKNKLVEQEEPSFLRELKKISLRLLCVDKETRYTMEKALEHLMNASLTFKV